MRSACGKQYGPNGLRFIPEGGLIPEHNMWCVLPSEAGSYRSLAVTTSVER